MTPQIYPWLRLVILASALVGAIGLFVIGLGFLVFPETALEHSDHRLEGLAQAMGGRYLFMGAVLAVCFGVRNFQLLGGVYAGFAGLGFIDAAIYWGLPESMVHLVVGGVCVCIAVCAMIIHRRET